MQDQTKTPAGEKRCRTCGEMKPLDAFYRHRSCVQFRAPDCKGCMCAIDKQRRRAPKVPAHAAFLGRLREMRTRADPFGHWLAGFIDGEGCFAGSAHSATHRRAPSALPVFVLSVRDDDAGIVYRIRDWTGIGVVRHIDRSDDEKRRNSRPLIRWTVSSREDCLMLCALLRRYPLHAKKRRDFEIWREMVRWRQQLYRGARSRQTGEIRDRLLALSRELQAVREYAVPTMREGRSRC